jgi:hypothetical protein
MEGCNFQHPSTFEIIKDRASKIEHKNIKNVFGDKMYLAKEDSMMIQRL